MKLKKEQAIEIANLMRQSLKIQNEIEFGDFVGKAPDIDFYPDYNLYYDPNRYEIHLGIYGIVDIFNVETEEEFVNAVNYGRGHEAQHRRSTATTPYQWGIERGVEMILEYISFKEEKSKRRFRSAKDYKDFADRVLPSMDIFISYQLLYQIIGGIANSIEDGRIERIRSNRFPGFEKLRIYHRGKFWTTQKREYRTYEDIKNSPPDILMAITDQILSLATCQLYSGGLSTPNVSFLDSGSVDPSRIYGLSFGDTDIFRKKGIDKKFDGCVYILIDNSGSMSGAKRVEACKAAALIEESFRGLIPIKIVAFDWQGQVIHEVVKGWNEQQNLNCCWNFCLYGRQGGGNADGYDILVAQKELLARPERKKLLIVLSDGMPAEASPGFTKGAIDETRKKGIQVSGIYFEEGDVIHGSEQFKAMYGNKDAIACPLSELSLNLEKIAKKFSRS